VDSEKRKAIFRRRTLKRNTDQQEDLNGRTITSGRRRPTISPLPLTDVIQKKANPRPERGLGFPSQISTALFSAPHARRGGGSDHSLLGVPVKPLIIKYMVPPERFRFSPTSTPAVSVKTLFLSTSGVVVIEMVTVPLSPSKLLTEPSCTEFDPSRSLANNVKESMTPSPIVLGMVTVTEPLMVPFTAGNVDQLITLLAGKAITSQQVLRKILVRGLLINLEVKTLTILAQSCFFTGNRTNSFIKIIKCAGIA